MQGESEDARAARRRSGGRRRRCLITHSHDEWDALNALAAELGVSMPAVYALALSSLQAEDPAPSSDDPPRVDPASVRRPRHEEGARPHRLAIRHTEGEWEDVTELATRLGMSVPGVYQHALREFVARRSDDASEIGVARDRPRQRRTIIRHTDEEWARVTSMAAHLGLSVPGFYERAAFAGSAQAAVELSIIHDELFGVRRLLANAANNLNQVARSLNTDGTHEPAQLAGSLALFETTIARLNELLAELPGQGVR